MTNEIVLANGARIRNAEERIREYCKIEVYAGYDDRHSVDDTIAVDDIQAANRLYAAIDRYESRNYRVPGILVSI